MARPKSPIQAGKAARLSEQSDALRGADHPKPRDEGGDDKVEDRILWSDTQVVQIPHNLGRRLAALRAERRMTQADLAQRLGKSRTTINQYEMGNITPPISIVDEIAAALDADPALIAFGRASAEGTRKDSSAERLWAFKDGVRGEDFVEVSTGFRNRLRFGEGGGRLVELTSDSPNFGLRRGDQLFVDDLCRTIVGDGRLYAVKSGGGELSLVRPEIQLDGSSGRLRLTFGQGQVSEVQADKIEVIGVVRAALKFE